MATEAQKNAYRKYDQENTVRLLLKLNRKTDADILAWLDSEEAAAKAREEKVSRQGLVKRILKEHIQKEKESE